jgi:hypothetical protein
MMGIANAVEVSSADVNLGLQHQDLGIMIVVADEPLCGILLELADSNGFDAFACETPLDVVDTLVQIGHRVVCAVVASSIAWGEGLAEFIADEYPHVRRIQLAA